MADLLQKIDDSLEGVELKLLAEFNRIRMTPTEARSEPINPKIRQALGLIETQLRHKLEHSGARSDLQLQTKQHENLRARLSVVRQLLKAKISIAFIREANAEVGISRQDCDRQKTQVQKNMQVDKKQATEFLDNGIDSPSRELAILAIRLREAKKAAIKRKKQKEARAKYETHDLSNTISHPMNIKNMDAPIRTPDELRRKLIAKIAIANRKAGLADNPEGKNQPVPANLNKQSKVKPQGDANAPKGILKALAARLTTAKQQSR